MTNAFILYHLVWKGQISHAANREGSFNSLKYIDQSVQLVFNTPNTPYELIVMYTDTNALFVFTYCEFMHFDVITYRFKHWLLCR